ncbi:ATP-binding protein [Bifidobacterium sp. LC6]|uniref:ATP-binding protein n=1 Tax=Bifidobacterium colobi TaxID=2809026 RepID=A0ABS5V0W4_9BIFI|nr:AAA family ATPase [Bifidobacterium colobi]MBT1175843.1 ATP-binding protein [Bifidobacterium colobi]
MFKRKIYESLKEWKSESAGTTALMIEGARRVGKSTIAEEFAKQEYRSYILIDWQKAPKAVRDSFANNLDDLNALFMDLSVYYGVRLYERDTLFIFDEVQLFPFARSAVKQLVADGRYDFMETGSLISIKKNVDNILIPSEEESVSMYPMDFEEFLWAKGEELLADAIRQAFNSQKPLSALLDNKAERLFREYMLVGGMPQAVKRYIETSDMGKVDQVKRQILRLYAQDIEKYGGDSKEQVKRIFDEIPGQLSKHEKKFTLASMGENARNREYGDAFFWLDESFLVNRCMNATDPHVGLRLHQEDSTMKCYMGDTGLLVTQVFADRAYTSNELYRDVLFGKLEVNEGMLVENVVAQQLRASGHRLFFYSRYSRQAEDRMEIDFLLVGEYSNAAMKARVCPVEVKSTKRYKTISLDKFKKKFDSRVGTQYVLHPRPMRVEGDRFYLPLYMAHCL